MRRFLRGRWRTGLWLAACSALVFTLWTNQNQNDKLSDVVTQQGVDRVASDRASCERGNELRRNIRDLAGDLGADADTLAIVNTRFAAVDCTTIPGS